jgi:molybdopterin-guanine dinucleotide biosynthesis protein A
MNDAVVGVLLAGGLSRRMGGGDKMLRRIAGETILSRVIARMAPQTRCLVLNANGDPARFATFGLPVAPDSIAGHAGPLAGVLTGMQWAAAKAPDCPWVLMAPTDAPFLPDDLAARMLAAIDAQGADMACASSGGRSHPVCGLWPVRLATDLRHAITDEHIRKVDVWTSRFRHILVDWPTDPVDPFFNANTSEDLAEAERILGGTGP